MIKIVVKNGESIDCKDKIIKFENAEDSIKYIVIRSFITGSNYKTYWSEKRIPENIIAEIYFEKSEVNGTKTAVKILGVIVTIGLLALAFCGLGTIGFSSKHKY